MTQHIPPSPTELVLLGVVVTLTAALVIWFVADLIVKLRGRK